MGKFLQRFILKSNIEVVVKSYKKFDESNMQYNSCILAIKF